MKPWDYPHQVWGIAQLCKSTLADHVPNAKPSKAHFATSEGGGGGGGGEFVCNVPFLLTCAVLLRAGPFPHCL